MRTVPSTVEQPPVVEEQPVSGAAYAPRLVIACYLLAAVIVTGRLWVDRSGRLQAGDPQDVGYFAGPSARGHPVFSLRPPQGRPEFRVGRLLAWQR